LFEYLDVEIRALNLIPHLALSHHQVDQEKELLRQWGAAEIDAVIIDPLGHAENEKMIATLQSWSIPVLLINQDPADWADVLLYDFRQSQERALQYLISLGHRQISYVGYHHPRAEQSGYFQGFLQFMQKAGLSVPPENRLFVHNDDEDAGREIFLSWENRQRRPTAVVCANDNLALSLMAQCRLRSLRVPEDLSVLGRDDVRLASSVGLSTLRTDRREAAQAIVRLVHGRLLHPGQAPKRIVLPSEFMVRHTIGPVPPANPAR
jgi:DNA-binding LacI/PurR family transcriptional regulator